MPVIGIDLGCLGTKVATIGRGGVAIVRNDLADRVTPTLVGYTDNERLIGDAAFTSLKSNAARTVRNVKHYLGLTREDAQVSEIEAQYSLAPAVLAGEDGASFAFDVGRSGGLVAPVEVLVPFLKKLKSMSDAYIGAPATDCVIAVPTWFSDVHRQAVLDACAIAGLGCHKVMQHSTATALDYGLFRRSLIKEDEDHVVAFIDSGYGQTTVTLVAYRPSKLAVLAVEESVALGGRALDKLLLTHFVQHFQQTTGVDLTHNLKALLKLEEAAEKAKKVLSANRDTGVHLECLAEDQDLNLQLTRDQFEGLIGEYLSRLEALVHSALAKAGITDVSKLASVEIVGGGTRVPALQAKLEQIFGRPVSRTLSADECVARGAAVQAAILDPRHRVAAYELRETRQEGLLLGFGGAIPGPVIDERNQPVKVVDHDLLIFAPGFEFTQTASRVVVLPLPNGSVSSLEFTVCGWSHSGTRREYGKARLELTAEVRKAICQHVDKCRFELKAAIDVNSMATITAQVKEEVVTEQDVVERIPKRAENGEIIEGEFDEVKSKKPKILVKTHKLPLTVQPGKGFLNAGLKLKFTQNEAKEAARDLATTNARMMRNEILSRAFSLRAIAASNDSQYEQFLTPGDREKILAVSEECEFFAEDNEDLTCAEYEPYAKKLQDVFSPVESRFRKAEEERLAREAAAAEAARQAEEAARKAAAEAEAAAAESAEQTAPPTDAPVTNEAPMEE